MAEFLTPIDDSPPPPAYEFTQQEFDQKTSAAVERSLAEPPRPPSSEDNDQFEEWDDHKFVAAQVAYRETHAVQVASGSSQTAIPPVAQSYTDKAREAFGQNYNSLLDHNNASSSTSTTSPLNFSRPPSSKSPELPKQKPSWYDDARLDGASSSSSSSIVSTPQPTQPPPSAHLARRQLPNPVGQPLYPVQPAGGKAPVEHEPVPSLKLAERNKQPTVHAIPEEEEIDRAPPPPFAPVDNSLDGPAYERVQSHLGPQQQMGNSNDLHAGLDSQHGHVSPPNVGIVLRYNGPDLSSSPPPSPPQSPVQVPLAQSRVYAQAQPHFQQQMPQQLQQQTQSQAHQQHHRSMPPPQRQRMSTSPRPVSMVQVQSQPRQRQPAPPVPRMEFDPSVAYSKPSNSIFGSLPTETTNGSPASLYNSAVASYLTPKGARAQPVTQSRKYTQPLSNLPQADSFSNAQQYQLQFQQQPQTFPNQYQQQQSFGGQDFYGGGGPAGAGAGNRMSYYPPTSGSPTPQYPVGAQAPMMNQYGLQMQGIPERPLSVAASMSEQPMWGMQGQQLPAQYYQHG